ncbi:MAG: hypothetical protein RKL24_03500 [Defluviicoccus sp.]|nr:hypothetical protein [Defluviicoccus sp.]
MKVCKSKILAIPLVAVLMSSGLCHAVMPEGIDMDPKFRAKIMKQRAKQNSKMSEMTQEHDDDGQDECGSQNIGVIESNGKPGSTPKEVIVYAPNAINVVSGRCR